jgi:two-component system response regulator HydG
MTTRPTVLVVDDKTNMLRLMTKVLRGDVEVLTAECGADAIALLSQHPVDVVLSDLKMPGEVDGLEVLRACRRLRPKAAFILMTAYATVDTAVDALRQGAHDYLLKPFDPADARALVLRALGRVGADASGEASDATEVLPGLIARARSMHQLGDLVTRIANSTATALIMGETGTGKERIARAIHRLSPRANRRFVALNCAAIPGDILESELFGHTKGAFTGANRERPGLFEEADGGTLFLDEIGEMRLSLQAKLTRALEERAVRRVGEGHERSVNVRIIAATHRDLQSMTQAGTFREDLWYRLNVAVIDVPPLRERVTDVEPLAVHFLREVMEDIPHRTIAGFTPAALEAMEGYDWPGNVRQLRAAVERACVITADERIDVGDLPRELRSVPSVDGDDLSTLTWAEALERGRDELGRAYLEAVLRRYQGRVSKASSHAGVERESFYRLLRRHGVEPGRFR